MTINNDHLTGFLVGLGGAALGFYLYRKNQEAVDAWLREQGLDLPVATGRDEHESMTLEELLTAKERFEDLIAEREMAAGPAPAPTPAAAMGATAKTR
jgi:hypothetical protein